MSEAVPIQLTSAVVSGWQHTKRFLIVYYLTAAVWGIRNVWHAEPSALDVLIPVILAVALGWWAIADARHRRRPIPMLARPWFFVLAGFVVPGYVIWSRGLPGVGWVVLNAAVWYVGATFAMHAGGVAVYGEQWLRALGA